MDNPNLHKYKIIFMKTFRLFLLRHKDCSEEFCKKIKKVILCLNIFIWKLCVFRDNVLKYGIAKHITQDHIVWYTRFAC